MSSPSKSLQIKTRGQFVLFWSNCLHIENKTFQNTPTVFQEINCDPSFCLFCFFSPPCEAGNKHVRKRKSRLGLHRRLILSASFSLIASKPRRRLCPLTNFDSKRRRVKPTCLPFVFSATRPGCIRSCFSGVFCKSSHGDGRLQRRLFTSHGGQARLCCRGKNCPPQFWFDFDFSDFGAR